MDRMTEWLVTGERPAFSPYISPFAKSASGSSRDDDDDDDDDDDAGDDDPDDDPDDDEDGDDPDAGKSDDEIRAELKAIRSQLSKANGSSAKRRRRVRELEAELESERRKPKGKKGAKDRDDDDEPDIETAREEARREGESSGLERAKKAEAKVSLLAAGINPARVSKAVGLLDLKDLDLDDEGLDGIDEAISELKREWPELFKAKAGRRQSIAGRGDRNGDGGDRRKKLSPSQRQAQLATSRTR